MPLEYDQTAVRALFATEGKGWTRELSGLLNNAWPVPTAPTNDNLFALEPHRHGRIPVVLVHGTASSPLRWADMVNDLLEDKEIRDHYEFWFFTYNTGNPIPISANVLRHSLEDAVKSLGGVQADPALGRMVVIGHSQGGLLTKLISIDSGTKLWDAVSDKPVDELNLKPETKALLKESLFVHHLPFVETVIFISTPHGGSYQASLTIVGLFTRLVTLPLSIAAATADVLANAGDALKLGKDRRAFNSINGMSPGNPAIEAVRNDPGRPRHPRPLHHPDAAGRPAGGPQRRRRAVQERPYRRRGVRTGDRTSGPFNPVQPAGRPRGPPDPAGATCAVPARVRGAAASGDRSGYAWASEHEGGKRLHFP